MPNDKKSIETAFEVVAIVCSLAGIPAALYCTWIIYNARARGGGGGALVSLDVASDLDLAFVVMLVSWGLMFLCLLAIAIARAFRPAAAQEEQEEEFGGKPRPGAETPVLRQEAVSEMPWKGYESEQAWRESTAENNRLVDLGKKVERLFDPLQLEAFELAKEMREFVTQAEPIPVLDANGPEQEKLKQINLRGEWREKLRNGYRLRFRERQEKLFQKFGTRGVRAEGATAASLPGRPPIEKQIPWEAAVLAAMAHRLDGVMLAGAHPE
jgi:hypothetical protein